MSQVHIAQVGLIKPVLEGLHSANCNVYDQSVMTDAERSGCILAQAQSLSSACIMNLLLTRAINNEHNIETV